jgi:NAD(P)-dependent dehydrogenase (short-subunit alcohol dehydrogenase family)
MEPGGAAVVTGASRGIGRAVAIELARRGFDVVATMRQPADGSDLLDISGASPGSIRVQRLDVTDPDSIELPEALRVLVNNAATEREHPPFEATPMELWRDMYETNVFGVIEVTRRAIPSLRRAGGGVLCNVTSSSVLAPVPFFAPYRSSKAAVGAIGESLRAELAPFGIRVVEVMPGPIDTDMLAGSARPPEAIEDPAYRAMAERYHEGRSAVEDQKTSADDAARAIVDAVLDDAAPLRVACDPLAQGLLDAWRASSDEAMMQMMLPAWAVDAVDGPLVEIEPTLRE